MQWRVYDRQALGYIDGGYAADYNLDDDYLAGNNSTVRIIADTTAQVGDVIALIKDAGAYAYGVVTAVDNSSRTISFKGCKELFNDNIPNPFYKDFGEGASVAGHFGISVPAALIRSVWSGTDDPRKNLPIIVNTIGDVLTENGVPRMTWTWQDTMINFADWLTELFENYNIVLSWTIDFDLAARLAERSPRYVVTLRCAGGSECVIKDNISAAEFEFTKEELPEKTVCIVLDGEATEYSPLGTWYLIQDDTGEYEITEDAEDPRRMLPVRTTVIEYTYSDTTEGDEVTIEDSVRTELIPAKFNHAIEVRIDRQSKMFDFDTAQFGDGYTVVTEAGRIESIYTGRRESSSSNRVTLLFGLGRRRYTDQVQRKLRKQRYTTLYRQR